MHTVNVLAMLILILPFSTAILMAERMLVVNHPHYPTDDFSRLPRVTEVVAGMPVVIRAIHRVVDGGTTSLGYVCADADRVRATIVEQASGVERVLPLERGRGCDFLTRLPPELAMGAADIRLLDDQGFPYGPGLLKVVPTRIGVLNRLDREWLRMPAMASVVVQEQRTEVNLLQPARPASLVEVQVIGFGTAELSELTIQLGDDPVPVEAAYPSDGDSAVHVLRFHVPETPAYAGCSVPLVVRTGEADSNLTTLPVADGSGSCKHKLGLTELEKTAIDEGGTIPVGTLDLGSTQNAGGTSFPAFGVWRADAKQVADLAGTDAPLRSTCQLSREWTSDIRVNRQPASSVAWLRTGGVVVVSPNEEAFRLGLSTRFLLRPGNWRLRVEGSDAVAPFEHVFRIAPEWVPVNHTDLLSLKRDSEPRLIWDGGRFVPEDVARVTLFQGFEHRLTCSAPAVAGSMTVPVGTFVSALAGPGSSAVYNGLRYDLESSGAPPLLFRFPMVDGSTGVGIIRVVVGNVVTRGLSVE